MSRSEIRFSQSTGELIAALAKAQGEFTPIIKDTDNTYYGSKYAQLDAVVAAVRPALSKHGIAYFHLPESDLERRTASVTTYLQLGEQWISVNAEVPAVSYGRDGKERFDALTISIGWTYLKRTQLLAITGTSAEDDDDGNALVGNTQPPAKAAPNTSLRKATKSPAPTGRFLQSGTMLDCVVLDAREALTKTGNKPIIMIRVNGDIRLSDAELTNTATCWDTKLFPLLLNSIGKQISLAIKIKDEKYVRVEDVLEIDGMQYIDGLPSPPAPTPEEEATWKAAFSDYTDVEAFNKEMLPLLRERPGPFALAGATYARAQGWIWNDAQNKYVGGAK